MKNSKRRSVSEGQITNADLSLIVFELGDKKYGANVSQICEVIRMVEITEIPGSAQFIAGVINLRGKVIPVIDLRKYFRIPTITYTLDNAILVAEIEGKTAGIVVDRVCDVVNIPRISIEQPEGNTTIYSELIEGIVKLPELLLLIVDFNKVLSFEEKRELENIASI